MTDNAASFTSRGASMKDLIVRGALVVLSAVAVAFPLIDVPSAPNFSGSEIMHPRILGKLAFLVPMAFALAAVHCFARAGSSIQKVFDGVLLALVVAGGAFLTVLLIGASRGYGVVPALGGYAYLALIVLAAWSLFSSLRR
jgi:amino acid permease